MHRSPVSTRSIQCAIYTRKSTEVAASQKFDSLDAQRDVCSAYIRCNEHRGWAEISQRYDDVGFSGGNLERPALTRLLSDVAKGRVDVVVVYKIDRLTRSLSDFVRLMDSVKVPFVSVTQSFDTSDSMGRLVLNILLTFAQFEREMLSDRIRDKFRAMRQRGLAVNWVPPLGYDRVDGRLVINVVEAAVVRTIFERAADFPSTYSFLQQLRSEGVRTKLVSLRDGTPRGGVLVNRGSFYKMLSNPAYAGLYRDGLDLVEAGHQAIIPRVLWEEVQGLRAERTADRLPRDPFRYPLTGILFDDKGRRLFAEPTTQRRVRQRYYRSDAMTITRNRPYHSTRIRADQLEELVFSSLQALLRDAERLRGLLCEADPDGPGGTALLKTSIPAAKRLVQFGGQERSALYARLFRRIEVAAHELRLFMNSDVLNDLAGRSVGQTDRMTILLRVEANVICAHRDSNLPVADGINLERRHDQKLVNVLRQASAARELLFAEPTTPVPELARRLNVRPSKFGRLIRISYLAPDILRLILSGQQPASLTARKLLYSQLPNDWEGQRRLLAIIPGVS